MAPGMQMVSFILGGGVWGFLLGQFMEWDMFIQRIFHRLLGDIKIYY